MKVGIAERTPKVRELTRFVVARGENAPAIARAADSDRLAFQRWLIAHFDRSVKAIHVEMNDFTGTLGRFHNGNIHPGDDSFQTDAP